ncbi:hypothetical protein ACWGB8_21450 [Kitasatospora sp. NPDC054939]
MTTAPSPKARTVAAFQTVAGNPGGYTWHWEGGTLATKHIRTTVGGRELIVDVHPDTTTTLGGAYLRGVDDSGTNLLDGTTLTQRDSVLNHLRTTFATQIQTAVTAVAAASPALSDPSWREKKKDAK